MGWQVPENRIDGLAQQTNTILYIKKKLFFPSFHIQITLISYFPPIFDP